MTIAYVDAHIKRLTLQGVDLRQRISMIERQLNRTDDSISTADRKRLEYELQKCNRQLQVIEQKIEELYKKKKS